MADKGIIACIIGEGFEDSEFRIPYDRLKKAGYRVDLIGSKKGQEIKGKAGKETVKADLGIDEADVGDYVGLFIPGGYSPDHLRVDDRFVQFVRDFDATKKTLAAVCHGPQLLITAGLVKGRKLTAWQTIQHDLRLIGADVRDEPVVVDDNWITSRKPDDLKAFSDKFIEELSEYEERGMAESQYRSQDQQPSA